MRIYFSIFRKYEICITCDGGLHHVTNFCVVASCQGQSRAAVEVRGSVFPTFRQSYHGLPHSQEIKVVLTLQHRCRDPVVSVSSPFLKSKEPIECYEDVRTFWSEPVRN